MKWFRNLSVVLVVVMALTMVAGVVSAQGPDEGNEGRNPGQRDHGFALVAALAEAADVTPQEVVEAWETDMTLADVAASFGVDSATLVADATATVEEHLQTAIENERLTQEEADEILANLPDTFDEALAQTRPTQGEGEGRQQGFGRGNGGPCGSGGRGEFPGAGDGFGGNGPAATDDAA